MTVSAMERRHEDLKRALIERDIRNGFALLDDLFNETSILRSESYTSISILFTLAQWIDLGYRDVKFLESQMAPFEDVDRLNMPLLHYIELKTVEAFCLLSRRCYTEAASMLDSTLRATEAVMPSHLAFVTHFWKGRAYRQEGNFELAMKEICAAKGRASEMGAAKLVAVTKIHEGWLLFHKGERRVALQLLDEAEHVLTPTGHVLSLANIAAARGRFFRSEGNNMKALEYFEQAISLYKLGYSRHTNYARALVNAAYVKRLMAIDLRSKMRGGRNKATTHTAILRITREAMDLLRQAESIYATHRDEAGTASVLVNIGHLQLERGEIEQAQSEATIAYNLGETKHNIVWMARARILQAYVAFAASEEQLESSHGSYARSAVEFADHAISLATTTQNRRLLAAAHITRGFAASDDHYLDWECARQQAAKAAKLINEEERDHLSRELSFLKLKIARSSSIAEVLQQWSNGELKGKTYQQVEEEFAEIVIPKVWKNLGCNVSRVAQELSISPKKIRRVLKSTRHTAC